MAKHILLFLLMAQSVALAETRVRPDEWASQIIGSDLKNFYQLDKNVFRSEQPDGKSFAQIQQFGIKEVLNLRQFHSDDDEAQKTGLTLHRIKLNTGKITYPQILQALRIIRDAQKPILIHCWHGSDRTGVVSAAYRMVFQDWSKAQAIDEFKNGGYGYHEKFYPGLVPLLEGLDVGAFRKKLQLHKE